MRVRSRRALALLVVACLASGGCRSSGPTALRARFPTARPQVPRVRTFDVLSYRIALEVWPEARAVTGVTRVEFAPLAGPLRELALDFEGLAVARVVASDGAALAFEQDEEGLRIALEPPLAPGSTGAVDVHYSGTPRTGLWFSGTRADQSGPTQVFTHGQSEENRGWFPCFDAPSERARTELVLNVPEAWVVEASGARVEAQSEGGRRTERWRMDFPHPSYLVSFVAGEFVVREEEARGVQLRSLCEPRFEPWLAPTFAESPSILAFLEDFTGVDYPHEKYSQACVDNFPWGGMENISATTLTPLLLADGPVHRDQPPFFLIAHEAAHQWFGDLVTCADWSHLWLNEGFATYFSLLYLEHSRGVDEFRAQMRETQEAYLAADVGSRRRPTVWNVWKEPDDVFDAWAYQGGAARLHLLRFWLGEEDFRAGLAAYLREFAGQSVTTHDLWRVLERVTGRALGDFFDAWLLGPGFPEFAVGWAYDERARTLTIEVEQVQGAEDGVPEVFRLPLELEWRTPQGTRLERVQLDQRRERFEFALESAPLYVACDPHGWIPKRVRQERELDEWLALARHATDVNLRREAVLALGRIAVAALERGAEAAPVLAELEARLAEDPSPWVRAEAATALGLVASQAEDALRRAALSDGEVSVRGSALYALRALGQDPGLESLAEEVFADGPSPAVRAAAAALFASAAPGRAFEFLRTALEQDSPHDVLATALLGLLARLSHPQVPELLRDLAVDSSLAPTARAAALAGLGSLATEDEECSRFLATFLGVDSFHLRRACVQALASRSDPFARRALGNYYPNARTAEERRTIEAVFAQGDP